MSILNRHQRAVISTDTKIDPILVDRVVEAYDALLRDDIKTYQHLMHTAIVQMNFGREIKMSDRPTAVDKARVICQRAIADKWQCSFQDATRRLQERLRA